MRMLKENFEAAITIAIQVQAKRDAETGVRESTFTAGLREILEASRCGATITVEEQ